MCFHGQDPDVEAAESNAAPSMTIPHRALFRSQCGEWIVKQV